MSVYWMLVYWCSGSLTDLIFQEFDLIAHCSAAHMRQESDVSLISPCTFPPRLSQRFIHLRRLQIKIR